MELRGISLKKIMYALTKIIKNKTKKKSRKIKIIKKNLVHFFRVITDTPLGWNGTGLGPTIYDIPLEKVNIFY